jgi:hypothetical protein
MDDRSPGRQGRSILLVEVARLGSIALDCADPSPLAAFWAELLGGEVAFTSDHFVAVKTDKSTRPVTQKAQLLLT